MPSLSATTPCPKPASSRCNASTTSGNAIPTKKKRRAVTSCASRESCSTSSKTRSTARRSAKSTRPCAAGTKTQAPMLLLLRPLPMRARQRARRATESRSRDAALAIWLPRRAKLPSLAKLPRRGRKNPGAKPNPMRPPFRLTRAFCISRASEPGAPKLWPSWASTPLTICCTTSRRATKIAASSRRFRN